MQSVYRVGSFLSANKINNDLQWLSIPSIVDARNLMLTAWYDATPFSHLLFVDADMGFPPELVADMLKFNPMLCGALYAKRQLPITMVGRLDGEDDVDGFVPAHHIGAGVMLIARKMITEMIERMPDLIAPIGSLQSSIPVKLNRLITAFDPIGRQFEDVSFCQRWRECGGKIWANVKHPIGHIGPHNFRLA